MNTNKELVSFYDDAKPFLVRFLMLSINSNISYLEIALIKRKNQNHSIAVACSLINNPP